MANMAFGGFGHANVVDRTTGRRFACNAGGAGSSAIHFSSIFSVDRTMGFQACPSSGMCSMGESNQVRVVRRIRKMGRGCSSNACSKVGRGGKYLHRGKRRDRQSTRRIDCRVAMFRKSLVISFTIKVQIPYQDRSRISSSIPRLRISPAVGSAQLSQHILDSGVRAVGGLTLLTERIPSLLEL